MTPPPLLPGSALVSYQGLQVEMLVDGAAAHAEAIELIREDVMAIAAKSRGWTSDAEMAEFARVFKIGSLFKADALALVWEDERVVGVMGTVYHPAPDGGLVLHLCSLGLLPRVQNRGLLPTLFGLLLDMVSSRPGSPELFATGRLYLTAVTQSPLIISFLSGVGDAFPSPDREAADPDVVEVAKSVMSRFDPDVPFDPETFVLRDECEFAYRRLPYSRDRRLNEYCDARLRYDHGDTFILVNRVRPEPVARFVMACAKTNPQLYAALRAGLTAAPLLTGTGASR